MTRSTKVLANYVKNWALKSKELQSGGYTGAGLPDYLVPVQDRKPHLMHATFFDHIKKCTAAAFSTMFVNTICVLEDAVKLDMHDFQPPLLNISLKTWGEYVKKKSHHHALFLVLEHFYETLKWLVISWDEHQDIALIYLQMMKVDSAIQSHRQHQAIFCNQGFLGDARKNHFSWMTQKPLQGAE